MADTIRKRIWFCTICATPRYNDGTRCENCQEPGTNVCSGLFSDDNARLFAQTANLDFNALETVTP